MKNKTTCALLIIFFVAIIYTAAYAMDAEITRQTLKGLQGLYVAVESIQPNIQKYAQKAGVTKEQMQKDIEVKLKSAGIKTFTKEEWLKAQGRPILYINVNTHEYEKYWYAYDIKVELQQVVSLEASPSIKTMAGTWSTNMTGIANIGTLNSIRNNVGVLTDRFITACHSVNNKK